MDTPLDVKAAILDEVRRKGACTIDELADRVQGSSWNQVFAAIDALSRDGTLIVRHPSRFEYLVLVNPQVDVRLAPVRRAG